VENAGAVLVRSTELPRSITKDWVYVFISKQTINVFLFTLNGIQIIWSGCQTSSEVLYWNKGIKRGPEISQMWFSRSLVGVTLRDKMRSKDIWQQQKTKQINEDIRGYQTKWMPHLERLGNNRVPQIIMNYKPVGLRDLGRRRCRWQDQVWISERALSLNLD
jgi:hypothetical protein